MLNFVMWFINNYLMIKDQKKHIFELIERIEDEE